MSVVFAWHVHHEVLVEPLLCPIEERIDYIKTWKHSWEVPIRLRLLKPVAGEMPAQVVEAASVLPPRWRALLKADKNRFKSDRHKDKYWIALMAYDHARILYEDALDQNMEAVEALHRAECLDCPWDGKTILNLKTILNERRKQKEV